MDTIYTVIDEDGPATTSSWKSQDMIAGQVPEEMVVVAKKSEVMDDPDSERDVKDLQAQFKIGYISERFGRPVGSGFDRVILKMFSLHDRSVFNVKAYIVGKYESDFWLKYSSKKVRFVDLTRAHETDACKRIISDELDMLIILDDLSEPCNWRGIIRNQVAPLQIVWCNSLRTTRIDTIRYIVADHITVPDECDQLFTEVLAYMYGSQFVADYSGLSPRLTERIVPDFHPDEAEPMKVEPDGTISKIWDWVTSLFDQDARRDGMAWNNVDIESGVKGYEDWESIHHLMRDRAKWGLPERAIVYCNLARSLQLEPETIAVWSKILCRVRNSVLWLLRQPALETRGLLASFSAHGVEPERIIFAEVVEMETHIPRVQLADIMLDNPTCNSPYATLDALWVGTPIVSFYGDIPSTKFTTSQLGAMGIERFSRKDMKDYYQVAIELGTDNDYLYKVRHRFWKARRSTSLFNVEQYCGIFEGLLKTIWYVHEHGHPPENDSEE